MWKYRISAALLLLGGCLKPGVTEQASINRAEAAAWAIADTWKLAYRKAHTNMMDYRVTLSPDRRTVWISHKTTAGAFVPEKDTEKSLGEAVTVERVDGMRRQADGTYTLEFKPKEGVQQMTAVLVRDSGGVGQWVKFEPGPLSR